MAITEIAETPRRLMDACQGVTLPCLIRQGRVQLDTHLIRFPAPQIIFFCSHKAMSIHSAAISMQNAAILMQKGGA